MVVLHDVSTEREVVVTNDIAVLILDVDTRDEVTVLGLDDDHLLETRGFIRLDTVGRALDEIIEDDLTRGFGDDEGVEGVELEECFPPS